MHALAQETPLRYLSDFWAAAEEDRAAGLDYRFEVDVLYYDAAWDIVQVQDETLAEYLMPLGPLPMASGQRVRLEGTTVPPGATFGIKDARVTVLGEAEVTWQPINVATANHRLLVNTPVEIAGVVESQGFDGADHLRLSMICDGLKATVWVMLDPLEPVPSFEGQLVTVRGVNASRFDGKGRVNAFDMFCPGLRHVTSHGPLAETARFNGTVSTVRTVLGAGGGSPVLVRGRIVRITDDNQVILRDETGQAVLETEQRAGQWLGETVLAAGVPEVDGVALRLKEVLMTPVESAENRSTEPARFQQRSLHRIAATALELSPEQAAKNHPVEFNGVVTWSHPRSMLFYLQDSSAGIGVYRASAIEPPPAPGRHIEVSGVTVMGDYAPTVQAARIQDLGEIGVPRPRRVTLEQALTGVEEGQWVEMTGFVHRAKRDGPWARLEMTSTAGAMVVRLPGDEEVADLVGSVVAVRGVCSALTNEQRRLTGIEIWANNLGAISVLETGDVDLATMPTRNLNEVGRFRTTADQRRRIKVAGTVLHWDPEGWVYLEDGDQRLIVQTRQSGTFPRGSRVEAAGFQGREGGRTVLRESVVRFVERGELPSPAVVGDISEVDPALDGRLVALTGEVVERFRAGGRVLLAVQDGRTVFECELLAASADRGLAEAGARVRVEGVYDVAYDDRTRPVGFRLLVDEAGQIEVLQPPAWWTRDRVMVMAGVMVGGVFLALGWVWTLQRRVGKQAYEINEQMRRAGQLEAELQQAMRLESLGTLAGGVAHDFNRQLSMIMDNLAGLLKDETLSREALTRVDNSREAAIRSRDLAHRLMTFAKGGEPKCQPTDLVRLVTETVGAFGLPKIIELHTRYANRCEPVKADPWQMKQLLQNLLLNAVQAMPHGGALTVEVEEELREESKASILAPGRYGVIVVRDNGEGIADRNLPQVFDPYFTTRDDAQGLGLAVVYTIARRHGGLVTLSSKAMLGTEVKVWIPVA